MPRKNQFCDLYKSCKLNQFDCFLFCVIYSGLWVMENEQRAMKDIGSSTHDHWKSLILVTVGISVGVVPALSWVSLIKPLTSSPQTSFCHAILLPQRQNQVLPFWIAQDIWQIKMAVPREASRKRPPGSSSGILWVCCCHDTQFGFGNHWTKCFFVLF